MSKLSDKIEERGKLLLGYLPAIYRMDAESEAFLKKYLGIFGYEIINLEEMIADIPRYFDPKALTADEEDFLSWLTSWLSLDLFNQYASLNREYMLNACKFYRSKGTEAGVISLLEFFSDGKVCVKDRSTLIFMTYCKDLIDEYHTVSFTLDTKRPGPIDFAGTYKDTIHYIYGGETYVVDAYLTALQDITDPDELALQKQILKKLVEPFVPAAWKVEIGAMDEAIGPVTTQKLLGNDDKSWAVAYPAVGFAAQKFTAVSGTLGEIRVKATTSCNCKVAIYSNNAGVPGSLLAYSASTPIVAGWNAISLNVTVALTATDYWLVFKTDVYAISSIASGGVSRYVAAAFADAFPDPAPVTSSSIYDKAIAGWGI